MNGERLRALVVCSSNSSEELPGRLKKVTTPMNMEVWSAAMTVHPDRVLAETIVRGVAEGFRIGYDRRRVRLEEQGKNMQSAEVQEEIVEAYIQAELSEDTVLLVGSCKEAQELGIHCSPFGVIPKKNRPAKSQFVSARRSQCE